MKSAYSMAKAELEKIRAGNRAALEDRWRVVTDKNPEIEKIRRELQQCGAALLRCVLDKSVRFEEVKAQIKALQEEKYSILAKNNLPKDFLDDIYDCEKCHDTGSAGGEVCECMKRLMREAVCKKSNMTEKMQQQTFENYNHALFDENVRCEMEKVFEYCRHFAETFDITHENLLLRGSAGTGKTYLSSCIANRAAERGFSVYYQSAYRLFEMAEQVKFGRQSDGDEAEIMKYVYDADLLIIDDLGTEFVTAFSTAAFFDIINERLLSRKSTLLSTNLELEMLESVYSPRMMSRFIGEYVIVKTVGEDLRMKNRR